MKYKYLLVAILIFLLSLGTVAASDDIINDLSLEDSNNDDALNGDFLLGDNVEYNDGDDSNVLDDDSDSYSNENSPDNSDSSSNVYNADLALEYSHDSAHYVNDSLKLNFLIQNDYGIAKNTKVIIKLSGVEYLSHNASKGTYDFKKGIWDIGTLDSDENAFLMIDTIIKDRTVTVDATATTSSNDMDNENNHIEDQLNFEEDLGRPGPVSESSGQPSHNEHYGSSRYGMVERVVVEDDDSSSYENDFNVSRKIDKNLNKNINKSIYNKQNMDYYLIILLIIGIIVLGGAYYKKRWLKYLGILKRLFEEFLRIYEIQIYFFI